MSGRSKMTSDTTDAAEFRQTGPSDEPRDIRVPSLSSLALTIRPRRCSPSRVARAPSLDFATQDLWSGVPNHLRYVPFWRVPPSRAPRTKEPGQDWRNLWLAEHLRPCWR